MIASNEPQDMEALRLRYEELNKKKITAETKLQTSSETLEKLRREARETYGTDDLNALRAKLEDMKKENDRKRAEYQQHLADIEKQLADVETKHAEAGRRESQS
jgi:hypothetical protein